MKPIDSETFLEFFDQDFRLVKEHEFRKTIFHCKHLILRLRFLNKKLSY